MNVHDWLMNLPFSDPSAACRVVEVSFNQGSRKDFFRNNTLQLFEKGDQVTVECISGFDVGEISLTGELVRMQLKRRGVNETDPEMKKVMRRANESDLQRLRENKAREPEAVIRARAISRKLGLEMKISEVEIQADGRKATFFYIADDRVDFRELIKIYASEFKVKVEMRQIGARQEAAKVGGIGSCGRELCCSTWLTDFKSVNTTAARYQNLSINQTKLSGQCGRLKCCLNYELDTYLDALQAFPDNVDSLQVAKGTAYLVKKDIFKNLMWFTLPDSTKHYPVTIQRVKQIKSLNVQGIIPDELEAVEIVSSKPREVEMEFVDVVGQTTLRSLERGDKKRKSQQNQQRRGSGQQKQQGSQQGQQQGKQQAQGGQQAKQQGQQQGQQNRPNNNRQQGQQGKQQGQQNRPNNNRQNNTRPNNNRPNNPKPNTDNK
jgi:cell fate regulator YaaT (PSP1 superfamily)